MEQLNRIELRGNIGNMKISDVGTTHVANFSVATNYLYKNKEGDPVIETTWHNIVAWAGKGMPDLRLLQKGVQVYVCGRVRISKFTGADGTERQMYEVVASKVQIEETEKETA